MLECENNNTGAKEPRDIDIEENEEDCKRPKVSLQISSISTSEVQVFPSSFSIAALIGAAAIRERVVTNLRLNSRQEEEVTRTNIPKLTPGRRSKPAGRMR